MGAPTCLIWEVLLPTAAPRVVRPALTAVLDDRAVLASDVGNCQMWARTFRRIATPESFMQSGVWNAMSYALPTAIVAKMEFPERDVVALAGDGAFLMTIGDLPTAGEYGANILMVILNDGAFGQTFMQQTNIYGHTYGTTFKSPNFAEMAEACGAKGIRVNAVLPGPIWTPFIPAGMSEGEVKDFGGHVPMGRPGQPAELASAYVMLAADSASYTSGTLLTIAGGAVTL